MSSIVPNHTSDQDRAESDAKTRIRVPGPSTTIGSRAILLPVLSGDSSVLVHPCDQSSHELTSVVPKSGKKILCRQASKKTSREEELSLEIQSWRKRRSPKQKTKKKSVKRSQSSSRFNIVDHLTSSTACAGHPRVPVVQGGMMVVSLPAHGRAGETAQPCLEYGLFIAAISRAMVAHSISRRSGRPRRWHWNSSHFRSS